MCNKLLRILCLFIDILVWMMKKVRKHERKYYRGSSFSFIKRDITSSGNLKNKPRKLKKGGVVWDKFIAILHNKFTRISHRVPLLVNDYFSEIGLIFLCLKWWILSGPHLCIVIWFPLWLWSMLEHYYYNLAN